MTQKEKFTANLLLAGFVQNSNEGASNWFETYENGISIFVGIMASDVDSLGHLPITVNYISDDNEEEIEKEYMTINGAWNAIKKLLK